MAFSDRPAGLLPMGVRRVSRFPCKEFPRMRRVFDCAGSGQDSLLPPCPMLPSASSNGVGTPEGLDFAAQWLACVCPCQRFADGLTTDVA